LSPRICLAYCGISVIPFSNNILLPTFTSSIPSTIVVRRLYLSETKVGSRYELKLDYRSHGCLPSNETIDKTIRARWGSVRKGDTEKVHDAIGLATHYYEMRPKPHAPPKGKIPPQFVPFIRQQQEAKRKREENAEPVPIADMT
jgi:hypothetical protein